MEVPGWPWPPNQELSGAGSTLAQDSQKRNLSTKKLKYEEMQDADYEARTAQFAHVKNLEQGCRSVWLYVDRHGKISWIHHKSSGSGLVNGKAEAIFKCCCPHS